MAMSYPKIRAVEASDLGATLDIIMKGFVAVKLRSLFPGTPLPCDIFSLVDQGSHQGIMVSKLFTGNQTFEPRFHEYLVQKGVVELHIRREDEEAFNEYFNHHTQEMFQARDITPERKAELLYDQAEYIVRRVFRERPTQSNIEAGRQLVGQLSVHALSDQVALRALLSLFSKDYYTFTHCIQVAVLGMTFCKFLGWKPKEVEDFGLGALFHDVGKNAIDERILNKPGKLDKEEFELIKSHPLLGYQQIRAAQVMSKDQLSVVLHHHEAQDGSGYPNRLKGLEIHKYARAARIADIYDAITTKRPYRDALPPSEALRLMSNEMMPTLDTRFFEAFIKLIACVARCP